MTPPSGARVTIDELLQHASWVKTLARQLLSGREGADDLVQQTWLAALEHPPRDRPGLAGWFRTLMRRAAARTRASDRARVARESRSMRSADSPAAADLVAQAEGQRLLVGVVLELPDPYRTTLLLRYFGGLSFVEIAEQTGTPDATVRVHHQRALEEIRRTLAARGQDDPGMWRSIALLGGAGCGAKAAAAVAGVVVMSAKAKIGLGLGILAALTMLAIWSPWKRTVDAARPSPDAEAGAAAGPGASGAPAAEVALAGSAPASAAIRPKAFEGGQALLGRVVDPAGAPVAGATVAVYPLTFAELVSADAADRPKSWPRLTKTDPEGNFAIGDLVPSSALEIVAAAEGWQPATQTPVAADVPIVLKLGAGVRLRGRVRDFDGAPVPGAQVRVNEISGLLQAQKTGVADSEGRYEVCGLGPGSKFYIEVGADGFAAQWINYLPAPDAAGISAKDFYIGRGAEVVVTAVDAEGGAPIPNARILGWAYTLAHGFDRPAGTVTNPKHVRVLADVRTGPDGRARIAHVPSWGVHPNSHNQLHRSEANLGGVAALADGYAIASRQIEVPDDGATVHVTLPCRRAASLAGRVVDESGAPIAGVQLWFRATTPLEDSWLPGPLRPDLASLKSDASGAYLFHGVPSSTTGQVEVVVSAWLPGSLEGLYAHAEITVHVSGTGTLRAPDLVLKRAGASAFRFRVLDAAGSPLWGARIDEDAMMDPLAITDREGRATCAVPAIEDDEGRPQPPFVFVRSPGFAVEKVILDPAARDEVVVRLRVGQRLAGRVVHEDGSPAQKAYVSAAAAEHRIEEVFPGPAKAGEAPPIPKGDRVGFLPVDASGRFEIGDLQPGNYHLEAKIWFERQASVTATLASVPAGADDLKITIPRPPPPHQGRLTVNVRERGTKRPVLRCVISMRSGWRDAGAIATAPGQFAASGLAPGRWSVSVRAAQYAGSDPLDVIIPDDSKPVTLDVELERGITMRGRLKARGVTSFADSRGWSSGPGAPAVTVAADGAYVITGLKAGASYDLNVTHQKSKDVWESFVSPSKIVIPDQTADVIERDMELVPSGGLGIRIHAPRLFDPLTRQPETEEQGRLVQESRVTVRAVEGTWTADLRPRGDNYGWRVPFGRYVVRLEVPGVDPQEQTVTVESNAVYVDFTVP